MKSTPPVSSVPDASGPHRRVHARVLAALLSAGALAVAGWLAFNASDGVSVTPQDQRLVALVALALFLGGITFYLAAAVVSGPRSPDNHGPARPGSGTVEADGSARTIRRIRSLSALGAVFAVAALLAVAGLGALRVLVPPAERPVSVQFSDITGRVQLEFCPSLPSSFEALAKPADLSASTTLLPVWVASRVCGNPSFQNGVWLYLNRSTITVADADDR
ncbi:hypothetical protein E3O25_07485 [Cryobacterium sp. TMT1-3]|uniref:hypothetical protein n=1 Tax=Cryobacterium sp. TMT1-3 TaxID=1259237 RepID=UPI00106D9CD8|nr:hypothetical protein [Cryobacterium sp. TMT1-3]TFC28400.1 hypothetical protein E3O25_07485 [Cryobacterium sp. TMT1-3]